jgi:hypothetical protein
MEKKGPREASDDLARRHQLRPSLTVEDFKSRPQQHYQTAGALASRMVIEASSYQTTPCSSPPTEKPSWPAQSLGIEIPFMADKMLEDLSIPREQKNGTSRDQSSTEELSWPSQSLSIEIPFMEDKMVEDLSIPREEKNSTSKDQSSAEAEQTNNNWKDKVKDVHSRDLSAAEDSLQESDLVEEKLSEPQGVESHVRWKNTPTNASKRDAKS